MPQRMHLVQVSRDAAVFDKNSEPHQRQVSYGQELNAQRPGSSITFLVFGESGTHSNAQSPELVVENVSFYRLGHGGLIGFIKLVKFILARHRVLPIDILTCQTIFDEMLGVLLAARLIGARVVGQIHFDLFAEASRRDQFSWSKLGPIRYWLGLKTMRFLYSVRVVGERIAAEIKLRKLHDRVEVIPIGVPALLKAAELPQTKKNPQQVLFIGRLIPVKRVDRFLRVAKAIHEKMPSATFKIIGDGVLRASLEAQAISLGIGSVVEFSGEIPNRDISKNLAQASVLMLTSDYEGFGRVIVEALGSKVPVVASAITGVEDIVIDSKSGFLVPPSDDARFCERVLQLLTNPKLATEMGEFGNLDVRKRFDPRVLSAKWISMLVSAERMDFGQLQLPKKRTLKRWRSLAFSQLTILRSLQYEAIKGVVLHGRTLDLGGGEKTSYLYLLKINGAIDSVNISPEIHPTLVADLNEPLAIADQSYDNVISLNTFEHLYRDQLAVNEALRILKPGGKFHFVVPFLYQVHGSPSDFNRRTCHWWTRALSDAGIESDQFTIEPLVWDRATSAYVLLERSRLGGFLKRFVMLPAVLRDLFSRGERLIRNEHTERVLGAALGYYIAGTK